MGPLFAEIGLQSGPISAPGGELGATTGRKTAPGAECIAGSPPGGDFYASWGATAGDALSVLPEYALLLQFIVPRHHVMIGCDKLYVHIQRVQASFAHAEYSG